MWWRFFRCRNWNVWWALIWFGISAVLSCLFFRLPLYNDWLYVRESTGWSCVTRQEWTWMLVWIVLLLGSYAVPSQLLGEQPNVEPRGFLATKGQACYFFLAMNLIWFILAMIPAWNTDRLLQVVGARSAWPAMWNLAMVVFPVNRCWPILQYGLGLQGPWQTMPWHVWSGHGILMWSSLHALLVTTDYAIQAGSFRNWWKLMVPFYYPLYTEGDVNFAGWLSFFALIVLTLASRDCVQKRNYETFFAIHVLAAVIFVVFAHMHDYNTLFFVQPALAAWLIDGILRGYNLTTLHIKETESASCINLPTNDPESIGVFQTGCVTVTYNSSLAVVAVEFPIPAHWPTLQPGMYVYLCRNRSLFPKKFHPFSVSSVDQQRNTFTIHVKDRGDWTSAFIKKDLSPFLRNAGAGRNPSLQWQFEGPYGGSTLVGELGKYANTLFLAGGVGLTGVTTLAASMTAQGHKHNLVWWVQTSQEAQVLAPLVGSQSNAVFYITQEKEHQNTLEMLRFHDMVVEYCVGSVQSFSPSQHRWVGVTGSVVAVIVSFLLGRVLCCSQPVEQNGQRVHSCSAFGSKTYCSVCDSPRDDDGPTTVCCSSFPCFYGFRGTPVVFSFVLAPILTTVLSFFSIWVCSRWIKFVRPGYHWSSSTLEVMNETTSQPFNRRAIQHNTPIQWCFGKADISAVLAEHLDPGMRTAIVVCGPQSFVDEVRLLVTNNHPYTGIFVP